MAIRVDLVSLIAISILSSYAYGQTTLGGPILGAVFDKPSRTLFQVLGAPGSAHIGSTLISDVDDAFASPNGGKALVVRNNEVSILANISGEIISSPILSSFVPNRAMWSSDSGSVALFNARDRAVQLVRIAESAPEVFPAVSLKLLGDHISSVVVHPNGEIIAAVQSGPGSGLHVIGLDGRIRSIASLPHPVAVTFLGSEDLIVADAEFRQLVRIRSYATNPLQEVVGTPTETPWRPVALATSPERDRVAVVMADPAVVQVYSLESRTLTVIEHLDFTPSRVIPVGGDGRYFIVDDSRRPADPFHVMTLSNEMVSVLFIPAGAEQAE